ncbi:MAG: apolipoprotein N-acyltransferase, partial [Pyrinomonadaceae bacterium]
SEAALSAWESASTADEKKVAGRLIIWPESPMSVQYSGDLGIAQRLADFAGRNRSRLLFNSLEETQRETETRGGLHNSALLIDEEGRLASRYDKIHLLPFGEFVPRWIPGSFLLNAIVGDFIPGKDYVLMSAGNGLRAGVFICFESAFPGSAAIFTREGADVLVNITNDGYLGRTPVIHQHLANAVFRAVENERTLIRVANTGISALITPHGDVRDETSTFVEATRTWVIGKQNGELTFYTKHQFLFVILCIIISLAMICGATFLRNLNVTPASSRL